MRRAERPIRYVMCPSLTTELLNPRVHLLLREESLNEHAFCFLYRRTTICVTDLSRIYQAFCHKLSRDTRRDDLRKALLVTNTNLILFDGATRPNYPRVFTRGPYKLNTRAIQARHLAARLTANITDHHESLTHTTRKDATFLFVEEVIF